VQDRRSPSPFLYRLALGASLALGAGAIAGLPIASPVSSLPKSLLDVPDRVRSNDRLALTFDDGPHHEGTMELLQALQKLHVRATFFLLGEEVEKRPELAAEIVARGHSVGVHGYRHRVLVGLATSEIRDDLDRALDVIQRATGSVPVLHRPPKGILTWSSLPLIRKMGLQPVLWAIDGRDWRATATPGSIAGRINVHLRGGEIVLLHDSDCHSSPGSWRNALGALPLIMERAQALGLQTVSLRPGGSEASPYSDEPLRRR
jgi:peptidoglycan-N-acetylglucosamine deacetylase